MIYPNIRIEMERGGFTVHQLATILGLPLNTLIYKLNGKCEFTLYEMECLADLFGCSLDYLVGHRRKGIKQARHGGMVTMEPFIRHRERGIP
ncbi:XRE family transcriptional regulator [Lachnoclostridium pacaense]|uniref:helix-turn-helix domain-containing protein n=1 Tax=Enterocloster hominis (ex Hitch et al. 2024) TaxID=1917870 RepID=UPI001D1132C3|nr:helix-turn-helix domain-containing protein [Lachnoclostridium pacaense]MCC2817680.1 XRE family transcriptional regulator [Lachnoclostridium pacaense]